MKTEIPPALVNLTHGLLTAQARLVELDLSDNACSPVRELGAGRRLHIVNALHPGVLHLHPLEARGLGVLSAG